MRPATSCRGRDRIAAATCFLFPEGQAAVLGTAVSAAVDRILGTAVTVLTDFTLQTAVGLFFIETTLSAGRTTLCLRTLGNGADLLSFLAAQASVG